MIGKLFDQQIVFIYVNDLEMSRVFYEEVFEFPLILDQGSCRIVKTNQGGGGYLGYCAAGKKVVESPGLILTLVTSQVDKWFGYLRSRGVDIPEPPKINPDYDIYHFFLQDPDGNTLEIQQFLDAAWKEGLSNVGD